MHNCMTLVIINIIHLCVSLTARCLYYRSSSLSELAVHTDSLKTEVRSVLTITRKVAEECTRHTISESIEANLSKMEALSHQLCQVTMVKLRHCQGECNSLD